MKGALALACCVLLWGCGGSGGGGAPSRASTDGPTAVRPSGPVSFVDLSGADLDETGVSASIDGGGAIIVSSPTGGPKKVRINLDSAVDLSYNDVLYLPLVVTPATGTNTVHGSIGLTLFDGATQMQTVKWWDSPLIRLQAIPRAQRSHITSIEIAWVAPTGDTDLVIGGIYRYGVWLSIESSATAMFNEKPVLLPLIYQTTYYNSVTGAESPLSPETTIGPGDQDHLGETRVLSQDPSSGPSFDRVRFYRTVTENQVTTRYRIAEVSNSSPTTIDKYPLDEVKTFPTYEP